MNAISSQILFSAMRFGAVLLLAAQCVLAATAGSAFADPKAGVRLIAHRAVYELKVSEVSEKSTVAGGNGLLVYVLKGDGCAEYSTKLQVVTRLASSAGEVNTVDLRQSAWESPQGDTMRFMSKQYVDGNLAEEIEGEAKKGEGKRTGTAKFIKPGGKMSLPEETIFPIELTKKMILEARAGTTISRTNVFDGAEKNKIYRAVAFIGKPRAPGDRGLPEALAKDATLKGQMAWPMTISYYDQSAVSDSDSGEQVPAFEISFIMFENGISTDVTMRYTDFTLSGKLTELEIYKNPECGR